MQAFDVWPGEAPGENGSIGEYGPIGEEMFREPWSEEAKEVRWLTNVTRPTVTVYRPAADRDTGAAMMICPGGGYWNLAWDLEGEEVAAWANSIGVTGFLLKYRVPRRKGQPEKLPAPGPLQDAQRALRLARSRAPEWGVDPERIGMIGFSAGAHLVAATATRFDSPAYEPIDAVDAVSARPDFAILAYPGYLAREDGDGLASYMRVPADAPPFFLAHASDDAIAPSDHSAEMYRALKRAGVSTESHIYASGGHGFGVRKGDLPTSVWTELCEAWLRRLGLLRRSAFDK